MNHLPARKPRSSPYLRRLVGSGQEFLLSPYSPHSWWHPEGRRSMVRRLEQKGFPQLFGWLFVTLTIDHSEFASDDKEPGQAEREAYEAGCDRIRRMMDSLRERYSIPRYFWKFELHEDGWPHWHMGWECSSFIHNDEVADAWGLGYTKTKRVKKTRDFRYLFKYVVKGNDTIPDWVLDYPGRIRVFQTSRGFYGNTSSGSASSASSSASQEEKPTLRVKFSKWDVRGVVRVRELSYRPVAVDLREAYPAIFIRCVESGARALDAYHVPLQLEDIAEYVLPWKIKEPNPQPSSERPLTWARFQMAPTSSGVVPFQRSAAPIRKTESLV